ncbi:hypothetical protein H5410_013415 [Solanum commersonii]|uniref:Uncharacterized protein n=1 Tax=Solanum commersonii TaxID=4109 RepID=A0A9J6AUF8_SOLCO|nr:hypothetical protein H5410_013415 [Solanum commersonii]
MNGNDDYSQVVRPCPYCKGAHFWEQCNYIPEGELCAPFLSCEFCRRLWIDCTVCCYPTPKPSHDDANNLCSFDSMKSCRKLMEEFEKHRRRIIYVSCLIDRKMKHFQDVLEKSKYLKFEVKEHVWAQVWVTATYYTEYIVVVGVKKLLRLDDNLSPL